MSKRKTEEKLTGLEPTNKKLKTNNDKDKKLDPRGFYNIYGERNHIDFLESDLRTEELTSKKATLIEPINRKLKPDDDEDEEMNLKKVYHCCYCKIRIIKNIGERECECGESYICLNCEMGASTNCCKCKTPSCQECLVDCPDSLCKNKTCFCCLKKCGCLSWVQLKDFKGGRMCYKCESEDLCKRCRKIICKDCFYFDDIDDDGDEKKKQPLCSHCYLNEFLYS